MFKIEITENQANQRLDRFLKKYFNNASLGTIYKLIRKDVKVNGKRANESTLLANGDELTLYISDETAAGLRKEKRRVKVKKRFKIAYEDDDLLIVEKPFGLLTHGDRTEKKNHLANQVIDYLIEKGDYNPRTETTFVPAPANRLDRNTTGLTIVAGDLERPVRLRAKMTKDETKNVVSVLSEEGEGKFMETVARPLMHANWKGREYTLTEVEILTGRTHQIRAHLAKAGYPVIGDVKYGDRKVNAVMEKEFGLTTQLLHAYKLVFEPDAVEDGFPETVESTLPPDFERIKQTIFGNNTR